MSSDTEGLSETEIASGCRWSMLDHVEYAEEDYVEDDYDCGHEKARSDEDDFPEVPLPWGVKNTFAWKDGAKALSGLANNRAIRQRLIYKLMRDGKDEAIGQYLFLESIPPYYESIIKSDSCLEILIQGIFYKVCKIEYRPQLNELIKSICNRVKKNTEKLIVYDRVGLIQKFIHTQVDDIFGANVHTRIPTKQMRNLLGAARLNLHLHDVESKDENYIVYMNELSYAASDIEYHHPRPASPFPGKRLIPLWRVRHLKPLTNFYSKKKREAIKNISELDVNLPSDEYISTSLKIFSNGYDA